MSKTRLIFATGNQGKVNEFKQMLGDEYEILSMKDIGVDIDIEENGTSFEENAVIKAKAVMEVTGKWSWQTIPVLSGRIEWRTGNLFRPLYGRGHAIFR